MRHLLEYMYVYRIHYNLDVKKVKSLNESSITSLFRKFDKEESHR